MKLTRAPLLPASVRRRALQGFQGLPTQLQHEIRHVGWFLGPALWLVPHGVRDVARARLDRWAARRLLQALVDRTGDTRTVRWLGEVALQYPLDAWLIQEMLSELRPALIVETGTFMGGSAFFFASLCDLLGKGEIISIDVAARSTIAHPRITYLAGSSTDPGIVAQVAARVAARPDQNVLVALDSDHRAEHVFAEMECYGALLPVGSYLHVQDGVIDELASMRWGRPGPRAAAQVFLAKHREFVRDVAVEERYLMTAHPYGWLKKIAPTP